uniref:Solute carrier family 48 member 1b n=1 Tax=Tetraodon nigroviridis TaxID=99883 RepID=H3BY55_TETNG
MGVKRIHLKIAYASFGMLMGFSAFLVWNIVYEQPWTAAMGGLSGKLNYCFNVVFIFYIHAFIPCGVAGLNYYIFVIVWVSQLSLHNIGVILTTASASPAALSDPRSLYLSSVWSVMSLKWSFLLTRSTHCYRKEFADISILSDF